MRSKKHRWMNEDSDDFFLAVLELESLMEARAFFGDVLTEKEIRECSQRWKTAKMLHIGMPYRKIQRTTSMSSATIAKICKKIHEGFGGYRLMLGRLDNEKST